VKGSDVSFMVLSQKEMLSFFNVIRDKIDLITLGSNELITNSGNKHGIN
jgi:hypothetical protein